MYRFPKSAKIAKRKEFDYLLKNGLHFGNASFGIRFEKGQKRRLGIVVSKKILKAAQRNRIKRIVREAFRLNQEKFPLGDVIVIARKGVDVLSNGALREALFLLLEGR